MAFPDRSFNRFHPRVPRASAPIRAKTYSDRTANDCLNVDVPPASTARSKRSRGFKQMHTEYADILGGSKAIGEAFDFQLWPREIEQQAQPEAGCFQIIDALQAVCVIQSLHDL